MDSLDYHLLLQQRVLHVSEEELVRSCYADIKMAGGAGSAAAAAAATAATADGSGAAGSSGNLLLGAQPPPLKFFILDCRPLEQYEAGHLPCAYHLDPSLLSSPAELAERVESLAAMKGCHFCFVSRKQENAGDAARFCRAPSAVQL